MRNFAKERENKWRDVYCWYCLTNLASSKDHIIPKSKDGSGIIGNKIPACQRCQDIKGNNLLDDLLKKLEMWKAGKWPIGKRNKHELNEYLIEIIITQTKLLLPYVKQLKYHRNYEKASNCICILGK